jgi:hypothetical protein
MSLTNTSRSVKATPVSPDRTIPLISAAEDTLSGSPFAKPFNGSRMAPCAVTQATAASRKNTKVANEMFLVFISGL